MLPDPAITHSVMPGTGRFCSGMSVGRTVVIVAERPAGEDRVEAIRVALGGLSRGDELGDIGRALFALHPKGGLFPGDVLIELAIDALGIAGVSRSSPLSYSGIREKYLPEIEFRGNTSHQKSHTALRAAAMAHGGVTADLDEEAGWWRADDFSGFAWWALVIYVRVGAERTGRTVADIAAELAARQGVTL
jgi:hypothetical protein